MRTSMCLRDSLLVVAASLGVIGLVGCESGETRTERPTSDFGAAQPPGESDQATASDATGDRDRAVERIRELQGRFVPVIGTRAPSIYLSGTQVQEGDLVLLASFPKLETLSLGKTSLSGAGLTHLSDVSELRSLLLFDAPINDAAIEHLRGLPIKRLDLSRTEVTDRCMNDVATLLQLSDLKLSGTQVSDAGIARLAESTSLTSLSLKGTAVTDACCATLAALPNLKQLYLADTAITDAGAMQLADAPSLTVLYLCRTRVSDRSCAALAGLPGKVFNLNLSGTQVTDAGILDLASASESLCVLDVSNTAVSAAAVPAMLQLASLSKLDAMESSVSDEALQRLLDDHPAIRQVNSPNEIDLER